MKFTVRFKIGNRLGAKSVYTLCELCVSLADRYSLTNRELTTIVGLGRNESFENEDMIVERVL